MVFKKATKIQKKRQTSHRTTPCPCVVGFGCLATKIKYWRQLANAAQSEKRYSNRAKMRPDLIRYQQLLALKRLSGPMWDLPTV